MAADKPQKILILGGTKEAASLAKQLVDLGHDVTTSLAGRTKEPAPIAGNTRTGGFGGPTGLAEYLQSGKFDRLIDATHPFALQISRNAELAAEMSGVPLEVRMRPSWQKQSGDRWLEVDTLEVARNAIPAGARVLLALGSQHISIFDTRDDVFYLVRMVDQPAIPLSLPNHELLTGRPSADWREEQATLVQNQITHIVCRNSGGEGAYAKIEAARQLNLQVIMVRR